MMKAFRQRTDTCAAALPDIEYGYGMWTGSANKQSRDELVYVGSCDSIG